MSDCPHCGEWRPTLLERDFCNTCGRLIQGETRRDAGTQESPTPDAGRPSPLKRLLLAGLLAFVGCAERPLKPEAVLPSRAQLAALLAAPIANARPSKPAPFGLTVYPRAILQGSSFRVSCHVPEDLGTGTIQFGLVGVKVDGPHELLRVENTLLIERAECGRWRAVCAVQATGGTRSAYEDVEVRGGMCEPDGAANDRPGAGG